MIKAKTSDWIKFAVITVLYLLFLLWVRSWLGLIVLPFIFDFFITKKIKWGFWKQSKNPLFRGVMAWIDAIVFGLVAVTFVNLFLFQMYQIPTSSLEKSLLVGDYLYVSKVSYGARIPNTPIAMPLTQHTLPIINTKSYLDKPHWDYKRTSGFGKVQLNDIVVFNFPAGDTVALNLSNVDFYRLAYGEGKMRIGAGEDSLSMAEQIAHAKRCYELGKKVIKESEAEFGKVVDRPVDRRDGYVKRCVGLPGNTLQIIDKQVVIDGKPIENPKDIQYNYYVQTNGMAISQAIFDELGISYDDIRMLNFAGGGEGRLMQLGLDKTINGAFCPIYMLPLTNEMYAKLKANTKLVYNIVREDLSVNDDLYPVGIKTGWSNDNYGPVWIPKKGESIQLTDENIALYERCIVSYERNTLERKADGIYLNGQKATEYTFKMDYYWMMGDNRDNSADSRYWGFVPEDHVIGKPIFVWLSINKDRDWGEGRVRWNRLFKSVH